VYVYLDDEEGVGGTGHSGGSVLQLSDVASFLAVVSLGTYVVGLFVFWYPISITYTGDFAAAWYATSLVSRNVVVGHGVQQLLLPYLALVLFLVVASLICMFVVVRLRRTILRRGIRIMVYGFLLILVMVLGLYLMSMYYLGVVGPVGYWRYFSRAYDELSLAQLLTCGALLILWACFLFAWLRLLGSMYKGKENPIEASSFGEALRLVVQRFGSAPRRSIAAVGMIFIAYFLLVLAVSLTDAKPPLSRAELSGHRHVKGELLTHTDGFWYVYEQREDKQKAQLVAIPDREVDEVQVSE